jgi:glycerophosphoryl diester phosphodiesterase
MNLRDVFEKPVAHRGLHDLAHNAPENSPSAFQRAVDADLAIECDIQLSKDGVPMVIHDGTIDRTTSGTGTVSEMTAAEIAAFPLSGGQKHDKTLRFDQLLDLVAGKVAIAVEMKPQSDGRDGEMAQKAVAMLRDYAGPLAFISFSPKLLQQAKKHGFKGPTGIVVERFVSEEAQKYLSPLQRFSMRHMLHYPKTRFDFIDCDHKALDLPMVRFLRVLGFPVAAWTIKSEAEAVEALKHCDQIAFEGYIPQNTQG